jgi:hypothetical protein
VRNLTGHGLGRWKVHTPPQIPNYGENGGGVLTRGWSSPSSPSPARAAATSASAAAPRCS